jgi:hypothetical protein
LTRTSTSRERRRRYIRLRDAGRGKPAADPRLIVEPQVAQCERQREHDWDTSDESAARQLIIFHHLIYFIFST